MGQIEDISESISFIQGNDKYKSIIENMNLGLLEVDLNEEIRDANNAFCRMVGYDLHELLGRKASELLVTDGDSARRVLDHSKTRKDGHHSVYEIQVIRKDKKRIWVLVSGGPLYNHHGKVVGSIGIHHDFTDKKSIERSLKQINEELAQKNDEFFKRQEYLKAINDFSNLIANKESLQDLSKVITDSIITRFGFKDCVVYIKNPDNDYLYQVSAFGPKNSMGEIVDPIRIEMGSGIVGSVAQTGIAEIVGDTSKDQRYILDDEFRYSEITVPITYDGEVLGIIDAEHPKKNFFTQDHLETLTTIANLASSKFNSALAWEKQLKIETELKESESKIRNIISSSLDAVVMIDSSGIITEWNPQAEKMFGFELDEAIGKSLSELIIPHHLRMAHERGMAHYRKTGEGPVLNKRIEITAIGKKRSEFPIELSIVPITLKNEKFFSAFLRDISEQKENQRKIEESLAREKELNEMKSKFVSMTSHEFRTPLTTIKSNIDLLAYKVENRNDQCSMVKNIDRVQNELDRLTRLMNDILTIGRIESGRIPFNPTPTFLHEFVKSTINQSFANREDKRTVDVQVLGKPKTYMIDPQVFNHIITNVLSNAFKYSVGEDDPELLVKYEPSEAWLVVKDHGIGIPNDEIEKISQSFYRASNVDNIQGSGLGLTIVKQFIGMHQGSLFFDSEEGKGTTVSLKLPYSCQEN